MNDLEFLHYKIKLKELRMVSPEGIEVLELKIITEELEVVNETLEMLMVFEDLFVEI